MIPEPLKNFAPEIPLEAVYLLVLGYLPLTVSLHVLGRDESFKKWGKLQKFSLTFSSGFVLAFIYTQLIKFFGMKVQIFSFYGIVFIIASIVVTVPLELFCFYFIKICSEVSYFEDIEDRIEQRLEDF